MDFTIPDDISGDNIVLNSEVEYCLWRGVEMTPENSVRIFGVDVFEARINLDLGLIVIEGEIKPDDFKIYINGKDYKECVQNYIRFLKIEFSQREQIPLDIIEQFELLELMPKSFNLQQIILFDRELDLHYLSK